MEYVDENEKIKNTDKKVKPKLLITISIHFSVRYLLRTGLLKELTEYAEVIILINWKDEALEKEFSELGIKTLELPASKYGSKYDSIRKKIDQWFLKTQLKSVSTKIHETGMDFHRDFKTKAIRYLRSVYNDFRLKFIDNIDEIFNEEKSYLIDDSNYNELKEYLLELKPDAVFTVTPFHKQEDFILRAASENKIPLCTSILSFDNTTKRGWIPAKYEKYMVWNKYNKAELLRSYPNLRGKDNIEIVGPAQFDFYWNDDYIIPEDEWREMFNIPKNKKVILYAGGSRVLFPQEPQYIGHIEKALKNGEIAEDCVILFRRHPMDTLERWQKVFKDSEKIILQESWGGEKNVKSSNISDYDIKLLVSTLKHTSVHINLCSTMTLDGSAFNKPQIGPAYDELKGRKYEKYVRQNYNQEHFNAIIKSKGLTLARNSKELIDAINESFSNPGKTENGRKEMISEVCSFSDGKSTQRVAQGIKTFLHSHKLI